MDILCIRLHKEIKDIESDILGKTEQINEVTMQTTMNKLKSKFGEDVDYIG